MSIKNNIDPIQNPWTSGVGIVLFAVSLALVFIPLFYEAKSEVPNSLIIGIGITGLCLLLIPDDLKTALKKFVGRKSDQL